MKRLLVLALLAASCGEAEEWPDAPEARMKCMSLVDLYCSRAVECTRITSADCRAAATSALDCGAAVQVGESYPRCMDDLRATTCNVFSGTGEIRLPASCTGVIKFPRK